MRSPMQRPSDEERSRAAVIRMTLFQKDTPPASLTKGFGVRDGFGDERGPDQIRLLHELSTPNHPAGENRGEQDGA